MAVYPGNLVGSERAKDMLNISSTATKVVPVLDMLINSGSQFITGLMKRPLKYGSITEYYDGTNCDTLLLRKFPIVAIDSLYYDTGRTFSSNSLIVEGDDFFVDAETGRVILFNNYFADSRYCVKVTYSYGPYGYVIGPSNDTFAFTENDVDKEAIIAHGTYTPVSLAGALEDAFEDVAGSGIVYTVVYSLTGEVFTVTLTGSVSSFSIGCNTGGTEMVDLCKLMGFFTTADKDGSTYYSSDEPSAGVDVKVRDMFIQLLQYWARQVEFNEHGVRALSRDSGVSMLYQYDDLPTTLKIMIDSMRIPFSGVNYA